MRILWVVPRYGRAVVGGAETHVRALATRSAAMGWDVRGRHDVRDGSHDLAQRPAAAARARTPASACRRFPTAPRDVARHDALHAAVLAGRASYADELEWLAQSVWSAPMQEYIDDSGHDLRIFSPYLFGTTIWGAMAVAAAQRADALPARRALRPPGDRAGGAGRGRRMPVQRAGGGAPGPPPRPRPRRRRGGDRLRRAAGPGRAPARPAGGPGPVPALRGTARGGEARPGGGRVRDARSPRSVRTLRRSC